MNTIYEFLKTTINGFLVSKMVKCPIFWGKIPILEILTCILDRFDRFRIVEF